MTDIPLFCNICPRDPAFSDVSHLLTHVASKGHLSQYNKAKLRGRQDASYREKLEAYDHWYQQYQIERLLSERMIAKESKDSKDSSIRVRTNRTTSRSSALMKKPVARQRRTQKAEKRDENSSPVKVEGPIDPRLSHLDRFAGPKSGSIPSIEQALTRDEGGQITSTLAVAPLQFDQSAFFDQQYHHSRRAPIPHMSTWQLASSNIHAISAQTLADANENPTPTQNDDTECESDYFQHFLRSPSRAAYPDPSEVTGPHSAVSIGSSSPFIKEDDMGLPNLNTYSKDEVSKRTKSASQSPVLRGVKWPGMSIFDSANVEAQRLRNQKKTDSVVEQMEHNSTMVEQLERIYWPDGSLKIQRLITGEVESSPIRELTPPKKLSKRRRTKTRKSVLTDISTNAPRMEQKSRTRKTSSRIPVFQASDLQDISQKALTSLDLPKYVHSPSAHIGYSPPEEKESERRLPSGLPINSYRKHFDVFKDEGRYIEGRSESTPKMHSQTFTKASHGHHHAIHADVSGIHAHREPYSPFLPQAATQLVAPFRKTTRESQLRDYASKSQSPFLDEDRENIEPILGHNGRIHDEPAFTNHERVTQRYFSVTGSQPPQFFSSMPPEMDFGGAMESRYRGTTFNPLNSYLRQQSSVVPQTHSASFLRTQSPPSRVVGKGENLLQPSLPGIVTGSRVKESLR